MYQSKKLASSFKDRTGDLGISFKRSAVHAGVQGVSECQSKATKLEEINMVEYGVEPLKTLYIAFYCFS